MQDVQTLTPLRRAADRDAAALDVSGSSGRRVRRCENETLLPKTGPLPHTSQTASHSFAPLD